MSNKTGFILNKALTTEFTENEEEVYFGADIGVDSASFL